MGAWTIYRYEFDSTNYSNQTIQELAVPTTTRAEDQSMILLKH